jgi:hypothetical protein
MPSRVRISAAALCLLLASALFAAGSSTPKTGTDAITVPQLINYQGKLTNPSGVPVPDGPYDLTFEFYDYPVTGNRIWGPEVQTGVDVKNGVFNVALGAVTPLVVPDGPGCWLQVTVGTELLSPRIQLTSVPYSYDADNADKLDGLNATDFASATHTHTLTLTGDATGTGSVGGSFALTLATVNSNTGTFGDATHVGQFTVNDKGLLTGASSVTITGAAPTGPASGDLTGNYPGPTIAANAVTTAKIANANVTLAKLDETGASVGQAITKTSFDAIGWSNPVAAAHTHTASGDVTGTVTGPLTLATVNSSPATYTYATVAVNGKGLVTSASSGAAPTNYWNNAGSYIYPNTPSANSYIQINGPAVPIYANGLSNTAMRADNNSGSYVALYSYNATTGACNSARIENASTSGYPALWCYNPNGPGLTVQGAGTSYWQTYLNAGGSGNPGLYVNGYMAAAGTKSCVLKTSHGTELMFCVEAPDVQFYTNGTGRLTNGAATVQFERLFQEAIAPDVPVKVSVTPVGAWSGIYVVEQTAQGFTVKSGTGDPGAQFNWIAIGTRKGYETRPVLPASLQPPDQPGPTPAKGTTEAGGRFK